MESAQLILRANDDHWIGTHCQGRDPYADLVACVCPLLAVELTVELHMGSTRRMRWVCGCCYRLYPVADRRNPSVTA